MDPLTQGVLGASLPQSSARRRHIRLAGLLGFLSGMAPDLDVLIQSPNDPLLFLEYHRQFTHALVFIPVGGFICAALFHRLFARRFLPFRETFLWCTLGYATHGLLDACTSYGTQLLWPFSSMRIAWNNVSVIDPAFSIPLLLSMVFGLISRKPVYTRIGLAWAVSYLILGIVQRDRAEAVGERIARSHGHEPIRLEARPSFGNLLLWKIVYDTGDEFHVDAARMGFTPRIFPGESIDKLNLDRQFPWLDPNSQQAKDVERFRWFSDHYLAVDHRRNDLIVDIRYSVLPNEIDALWGIRLSPGAGPDEHVEYVTNRTASNDRLRRFVEMLFN